MKISSCHKEKRKPSTSLKQLFLNLIWAMSNWERMYGWQTSHHSIGRSWEVWRTLWSSQFTYPAQPLLWWSASSSTNIRRQYLQSTRMSSTISDSSASSVYALSTWLWFESMNEIFKNTFFLRMLLGNFSDVAFIHWYIKHELCFVTEVILYKF